MRIGREFDTRTGALCLMRMMTITALACCLVVGVAAAAILGRDSIPAVPFFSSSAPVPPAVPAPTANRDGKADRLAVAIRPASAEISNEVPGTDLLRQALATDGAVEAEVLPTVAPIAHPPLPHPRPKLANQLVQKNYSLLSDMQIAALKGRLQLTRAQEPYWPAVESALRDVARKVHARHSAAPGTPANLGPADIQQIKTAAQPLLTRLREDQKREARSLARVIGLEAVASLI
jgi:hypothetical protein